MNRLTQKELSSNEKVICNTICHGNTYPDCDDSCMKTTCKWQEKANKKLWEYENAEENGVTDYNKGMNDAWDLARRLFLSACDGIENALTDRDLNEIFETINVAYIVNRYTPQEVKSKIEAWEKANQEIKVGDVVMDTENDVFVVLRKLDDFVYALLNTKGQHKYLDVKYLTKTGRTIDIASVLEQIGGTV